MKKGLKLDLPPVDYDMLARKARERVEIMKHWPIDNLADRLMRDAYSVVMVGSYDSKSPMALEIRTACFQLMADLDATMPPGYPERSFADKIKISMRSSTAFDGHATMATFSSEL